MKKSNVAMIGAAMLAAGYGMYRYYKSHSYEINGCVKDTMKKIRHSMEEIDENMM